jgi:hypothetical protein
LFVCICVLYYRHRAATQLQLNIYHIIYHIIYQLSCRSVAVVLTIYMKWFVHIVGNNKKYYVARQQRTGTPLSHFMAKLDSFQLLRAQCVCKVQTERIAVLSQHFQHFKRIRPQESGLIASSYTSVCLSVCLSVRMPQFGSHWPYFGKMRYCGFALNF